MITRTALVVGGTSGIGLGVAKTLSRNGIITYIVGRRPFEEKVDSQTTIRAIQADLVLPESVEYIQKKLLNVKLDYVVFSASTEAPLKKFSEITPEEYDYALSLNLRSPFFLAQAILNNLKQNSRLLFITSRLSASPEVGSLIYCMTKSAIEIFSAGLNQELKGKILSSSVIPSVVDTEMQERLRGANPTIFPHAHVYREMKPRLKTVENVSKLIVSHLCDSDDATFVNQRVDIFNNKNTVIASKL